jgi:tRNA G26 N,N-dimethylase Trm1
MVLFLERINPPNLIKRSMSVGQKVADLQSALLRNIRDEYEHNMSQQLYIGETSWETVKTAKEDVARLINTSAAKFKTEEAAAVLAKDILTSGFDAHNDPIEKALLQLKREVRENY